MNYSSAHKRIRLSIILLVAAILFLVHSPGQGIMFNFEPFLQGASLDRQAQVNISISPIAQNHEQLVGVQRCSIYANLL